jgi:hypothetical protein
VMLAISSKESAFALLPLSVVLYAAPRLLPLPPRSRLPVVLPVLAIVIMGGFLVTRVLLYGSTLGGYGVPLSVHRLVSAPLLASVATAGPARLAIGLSASGLATLAAGLALTGVLMRVAPLWTLCGLSAVLPAAHLIATSMPLWEVDRFFYMASIWMAGAWATGVVALHAGGRRKTAVALAALLISGSLVHLVQRLDGLRTAAAITRRTDETLRRASVELPTGSVVLCAGLPDNVEGAYVYRNGCVEQVALRWPNGRVTGAARLEDVPAGTGVFALSPDGSVLRRVR